MLHHNLFKTDNNKTKRNFGYNLCTAKTRRETNIYYFSYDNIMRATTGSDNDRNELKYQPEQYGFSTIVINEDNDMTNIHDQLPSVEDAKANIIPQKYIKMTRENVHLILWMLANICCIVLVSCLASKFQKERKLHIYNHNYEEVVNALSGHVDTNALNTPGTLQNKAVIWMATHYMKNENTLQRFALVLLFFSNVVVRKDGNDETSWGQLQLNFRPLYHECDWNELFRRSDDMTVITMGVECDENEEVTSVVLENINLVGTIPLEIALLSKLTFLSLDGNQFTGSIPSNMQYLTMLTSLTLGYNALAASTIPHWIGSLTKLHVLNLAHNAFTGTIPESLFECRSLVTLSLSHNNLTGNLSVLTRMTWLEHLLIKDNSLTGVCDDSFFQNHGNLKSLDASNNVLQGKVSQNLLLKASLRLLDLGGNYMNGPIPELNTNSTSAIFSRLEYLALQENRFTGSIPHSIGTVLTNLVHLDISTNGLTGEIPTSFTALTQLEYLFLANNTGFTASPIPLFLKQLTALQEISFKHSSRTGTIPNWIGNIVSISLLDLESNKLTGTVPSSIGSLTKLAILLLNHNDLTGTLVNGMSQLSNLVILGLDRNSIVGHAGDLCNKDKMSHLEVFTSDCRTDEKKHSTEFTCSCCTTCCKDSDTSCNDGWLLAFHGVPSTSKSSIILSRNDNAFYSDHVDYIPVKATKN